MKIRPILTLLLLVSSVFVSFLKFFVVKEKKTVCLHLFIQGTNKINWDDVTLEWKSHPFLEYFQEKGCQKFNSMYYFLKRKMCATPKIIIFFSAKIVGGREAQPNAHPHQVALLMRKNGQEGYSSFCGGSLISKFKVGLIICSKYLSITNIII